MISFRVLSQGLLKDHAVAVFYELTTRKPSKPSYTTSVDSTLGNGGSTSAVGGLPAGGVAEPLGTATSGHLEQALDADDDDAAAALAFEPGPAQSVPVGW